MDWGPANWAMMIPIVSVVGAFAYIIVLTVMKARVRELEVRQRIAMIERGLVPPPEVDPRGFERAMSRMDARGVSATAARHRRAGIILLGVGFGLMILISVAGEEPSAGIGVGGFLVVVGLAFLANSWFEIRQQPPALPHSVATPAIVPPDEPRRD